jgi:large subunit ribosomal protein L6
MTDKIMIEKLPIPEGITVNIDKCLINLKGKKGEVSRLFNDPKIVLSIENKEIIIKSEKSTQREKKKIFSIRAHLKNMIKGVEEGFIYTLKICTGHFPMNVSVSGNKITVKNFLGEKIPRVLEIKKGVKVNIDGNLIKVEGNNKETVSQVAADIEQLCRVTNRDRRIFQDGIYIINKAGKEI